MTSLATSSEKPGKNQQPEDMMTRINKSKE